MKPNLVVVPFRGKARRQYLRRAKLKAYVVDLTDLEARAAATDAMYRTTSERLAARRAFKKLQRQCRMRLPD